MNLYLIEQDINNNYDTYDSAVVAAESRRAARRTLPDGSAIEDEAGRFFFTWVRKEDIEKVKVTLIGVAVENITAGVICASFNAG